jgi:polysaccharide chain length determinant protein (PEP-CTERM system associated)
MLPGQKYTPEDVVRILWNRKWLYLVPLAVAFVSSFAIARKLPSTYRSETLLQLIPQRIPENYIPKTGTSSIEDRLNNIKQVILSRSRLEAIIQEFNLYAEARQAGVMEDIVEKMRTKDIGIKAERGDAFRLYFIASDPRTAKKVTERLASLFIDENIRDREALADQTIQFLEAKLEDARKSLEATEKKLEDYKRLHSTELPSQVQANIQAMSSTRLELASLADSMNRDRDRRLTLEQQIATVQDAPIPSPVTAARPSDSPDGASGGSTADQLALQKARLELLSIRYKEDHPDVMAVKRLIRDLELKLQKEMASQPAAGETTPALSAGELARQKRLSELRAELQNVDRQLSEKVARERQLRDTMTALQGRLDAAPTRESELIQLTRDYETINATYKGLLQTLQSARFAGDVVRQQIGEQFKILDPARMPERPYTPDRPRIVLMGSALGLAIGLALIALLEYRDSTFKTEEDVLRVLQLPVLALVPIMASEREMRASRRRKMLVALAGIVMVVSSAAALLVWRLQGS